MEDQEAHSRRDCISRLEAELRRYHLAIVENVQAIQGLGSIRKIMTANHAVWLRVSESEATAVYAEATR